MRRIFRATDNPFDDNEISRARLADFGADAARRLAADFPTESADVARCAAALTTERSGLQQAQAQRSTNTGSIDTFLADLSIYMRKERARISVDLGEDSAAFAALYPNGLRTYSQLTKSEAEARLLTIKETIEDTGDTLHEPTRMHLLGLHRQWKSLRDSQQDAKGDVSEGFGEGAEARAALEDALFEALLQVARKNKRDPRAARRYFDHTLLDAASHATHEQAQETPAT